MTIVEASGQSWMRREIEEIPEAAGRLAGRDAQAAFEDAGEALRARAPACVVTLARGSSDHAATCLKYAIELVDGVPVASLGPSIASVFGAGLHLERAAGFAISQSGESEDLVRAARAMDGAGACTIALTNSPGSPLAEVVGRVQDVLAGPEQAVAATKSYVNSVLAGLWVLAHWQRDAALMDALHGVPERLGLALALDMSPVTHALLACERLVVLGRGPTLGVAQEVALKAMEVCGIPAVAYSSAEVLHGPSAILTDGYPVLGIISDPQDGVARTAGVLRAQGAGIIDLPTGDVPRHRAVPALDQLVALYAAIEAAARLKGLNPDKPENLKKVTSTV